MANLLSNLSTAWKALGLRAAPSVAAIQDKGKKIEGLEAVRGLAALVVLGEHSLGGFPMDSTCEIPDIIGQLFFAHAAVLLFFLLSGYVIGLATMRPFTAIAGRIYALKRFFRIYPIFILSLLLAWTVAGPRNVVEAIGSFFVLTAYDDYFGLKIGPPAANVPLWSLSYEAFYYVLFVAIWAWSPRWRTLFGIALGISIVSFLIPAFPAFLDGWASGFLFWGAGLWLAWNATRGATLNRPLITWCLLMAAVNRMPVLKYIGIGLMDRPFPGAIVGLKELALLPTCLLVVCDAAGIVLPWRRVLIWLAFILPIGGTAIWIHQKGLDFHDMRTVVALIDIAGALACYRIRGNFSRMGWLAWIGGISYGIYALHFPIQNHFINHFPWNGTLVVTVAGYLLFYATVVLLAWVVETGTRKFLLEPLRDRIRGG
ncbi:hypothetical protein BH09SUM1_BH09SUM1_32160 [soil metagenome]